MALHTASEASAAPVACSRRLDAFSTGIADFENYTCTWRSHLKGFELRYKRTNLQSVDGLMFHSDLLYHKYPAVGPPPSGARDLFSISVECLLLYVGSTITQRRSTCVPKRYFINFR